MNIALKNISGKYILFVDVDDYIDERYLETLINTLHTKKYIKRLKL